MNVSEKIMTAAEALGMITTPTTPDQRDELRKAGFIHATGLAGFLHTQEPGTDDTRVYSRVSSDDRNRGHWDSNNGTAVLYTSGGEVWVKFGNYDFPNNLSELAPNGRGAYVPFSNGEMPWIHDALGRVGDPDAEPAY